MISKPAWMPLLLICSERTYERLLGHGRAVAVAIASLALCGCGRDDPAADLLEDYRSRVERVLEAPSPVRASAVPEAWPRARDRHLDVPPQRIDLIDFLRLNGCGLGALAGMRASSLGRVMTPPERLRYELRFTQAGQRCLDGLEGEADEALRTFLSDALELKRAAFGAVIFNATLGSDALAQHHGLDVRALDPGALAGAGDVAIAAVHELAVRAAGEGGGAQEDWHAPWQALEASRYGGRLHRSLVLLERDLGAVAELIEEGRSLCPLGSPSDAVNILANVFRNVYVARVQPYMAGVESGASRFDAALDRLIAAQRAPVPQVLEPTPVQRSLNAMRRARDRHTRAWQQLHRACGLEVGTRPD